MASLSFAKRSWIIFCRFSSKSRQVLKAPLAMRAATSAEVIGPKAEKFKAAQMENRSRTVATVLGFSSQDMPSRRESYKELVSFRATGALPADSAHPLWESSPRQSHSRSHQEDGIVGKKWIHSPPSAIGWGSSRRTLGEEFRTHHDCPSLNQFHQKLTISSRGFRGIHMYLYMYISKCSPFHWFHCLHFYSRQLWVLHQLLHTRHQVVHVCPCLRCKPPGNGWRHLERACFPSIPNKNHILIINIRLTTKPPTLQSIFRICDKSIQDTCQSRWRHLSHRPGTSQWPLWPGVPLTSRTILSTNHGSGTLNTLSTRPLQSAPSQKGTTYKSLKGFTHSKKTIHPHSAPPLSQACCTNSWMRPACLSFPWP